MHPTAARTNRSSLQATIPSAAASPLINQHQQQVLYSPIANPVVHYQPCATGLHPACVYPGLQHNSTILNPTPNHMQEKNARWPSKNKVARSQQQHVQQQLSYNPKPVVLYDQATNNGPATPQPTASLLVASSTFAHGSFPNDQYSSPGTGLIPQYYYKPQDVQAFCLQGPQQHQQEHPIHGSYYNLAAANTCSLQTINTNSGFQVSNLGSYTGITSHQVPGAIQAGQPGQIFTTSPVNLTISSNQQKEKPSALDISGFKYTKNKMPIISIAHNTSSVRSENYTERLVPTTSPSTNTLYNAKAVVENVTEASEPLLQKVASGASSKTQEEHYSDESSASFDFTIEAEKMVSALCTSSNDLEKEDARNNKKAAEPLFSGAGDTGLNKNDWFVDFCCTDYGNRRSVAIQTENLSKDRAQYPELVRKIAYWGCSEAEIVLSNSLKADPRAPWLKQLSFATKTAITKSSTSFPIFAGDRIFVSDLITALLRITNGWLILDNYFNKQHYPSLSNKFDTGLLQHFQAWEANTYEVLNQIVHTFKKLDENSEFWNQEDKANDASGTTFSGKSLYTSLDLFDPILYVSTMKNQEPSIKTGAADSMQFPSQQLFAGNFHNVRGYEANQKSQQATCSKEAKLRSKWTVTENPTTTSDSPKSVPNMFIGLEDSGQASSRFRMKGNTSTLKLDSSTRSLNAEFFHLRSKVLETTHDLPRQWVFKEKKPEPLENKLPLSTENESSFKPQRFVQGSCENPYAQKYFPCIDGAYVNPSPVSLESVYFTSTADASTSIGPNYALSYTPYTMTDYSVKYYKNFEQSYESRDIDKSPMKQLELAAVPRNKMTLLSQIEPCTPEKASEEMTANLSAWFASMRSSDSVEQVSIPNVVDSKPVEAIAPRLRPRQELSKNALELARQLQMDTNRQLQTLQNMQSIQRAPWTALNLINNCSQVQHANDDYDSSEDVRVYMKPGSYNVPKKKHQRKSNRRTDNSVSRNQLAGHRNHYSNKEKTYVAPTSSTPVPRSSSSLSTNVSTTTTTIKLPFPATPIVPPPTFSLENSPRILRRSDASACGSKSVQDVTWKAACASAEILLDALNVKGDADNANSKGSGEDNAEDDASNIRKDDAKDARKNPVESQARTSEKLPESLKRSNDCDGASSYEASGDDSESPYRLSPNTSLADISQSPDNRNGLGKTNVKTDSWLIRTLNSVSIISKQKRRKMNNDQSSSESTNSSVIEDEDDQTISMSSLIATESTSKVIAKEAENIEQTKCSREGLRVPSLKNDHSLTEEVDRIVGKATYSETVRRSLPLSASHAGRKEVCKKNKLNSTVTPSICSTVIPIPGRKCQRKDPERSFYLLQKSRKSYTKKPGKSGEAILSQSEEGSCSKIRLSRSETAKSSASIVPFTTTKSTVTVKSHMKKKDNVGGYSECLDGRWPGKSSDRGWSVWYSSKRKQTLSPLALSKLEMIHQTVWKMEEAQIFKHPSGSLDANKESAAGNTLEQYSKVVEPDVPRNRGIRAEKSCVQ